VSADTVSRLCSRRAKLVDPTLQLLIEFRDDHLTKQLARTEPKMRRAIELDEADRRDRPSYAVVSDGKPLRFGDGHYDGPSPEALH
jgi:hypothetical protein